ncbi:hypothetical protein LMG28688_05818 [Paraburkholderia caffeinitolerans]|uniref:Uncharacterized protein n=1 Tax=Paraburkholderia caffeinitolerans TaxID=1723730 RepID=A0A6J5GQA2_9BURK|nr:hypothetical protein [Paraburkholderia caffeinitolerans]CAB3803680.1 hypothetical protein LMG28688_05818 [Paraburkholderia caffeinitolerans]
MTDYSKRNEAWRDGEHRVARERTVDVDQSATSDGSNGVQRHGTNWAWARSNVHYDWMDHASPFDNRN